jgi:RND family efflux transporter MFP subunit
VVAINDLDIAEKSVEAARAVVQATQGSMEAAKASTQALRDLQGYLTIRAPFDGIVVERDVHPGALVGPASQAPLLKLQQVSHLRLTVAVPEAAVGGIVDGARVPFTVAAFPGVVFHGLVSRIAHSMDEATRSMAVELDVTNPDMKLAPGMYPEVTWPVRNPQSSLLVPPSSIVTTTERMFVIRVRNGVAEWVTVTRGAAAGDLVEVIGALKEGDLIVRRGSDELREGTPLKIVGKVAAAGAKVPLSSGHL